MPAVLWGLDFIIAAACTRWDAPAAQLCLCFVFLVIIETVYCTWKICKFSQLLRTILFVIPFLWREWQFTVQRTASSQEELSHGLPNQDRNGNRHRCLRISTVIANRKEKYGTCKAAQQLWSFPLTSDSALSPRPFVPLAAAWPLSPACFSVCISAFLSYYILPFLSAGDCISPAVWQLVWSSPPPVLLVWTSPPPPHCNHWWERGEHTKGSSLSHCKHLIWELSLRATRMSALTVEGASWTSSDRT